jgi:soluble lytic murein transglycosylase-like protein
MLNARPAAEAVDDDEPAAAPDIRHTVTQHAQKNGLHPDLVLAVIQAESAFNPLARSPKGALGLMQVMPTTARDYGVDKPEAVLTAEQNIRVGTVHLARLVRKFGGDIPLALAAYNAGEGAVMRSGWRIPPYPETERYVQKVMRSWAGEEEGGRP